MDNKPKILEIIKNKNHWFVIINNKENNEAFKISFSDRKGKKYMGQRILVNKDGKPEIQQKKIHFGSSLMGHYRDKIGGYDELDHNDEQRRINFYNRFKDAKNASIDSPLFWSANFLW